MLTMRDAFFLRVFEQAKVNPDIVVLTSDFSAPSFDRFRAELPGQFINTGISEQNTILVATGLALSGKIVFVTSIAPFITMRCFEQTRLFAADMNLNIKIVAVGAGFSYNTAGPTHHSIEDIALMRALPNMRLLLPCCNSQVDFFAGRCTEEPGPTYIRLDRMVLDEQYGDTFSPKSNDGFSVLRPIAPLTIIASGYTVQTALAVAEKAKEKGVSIGVIDMWQLPLQSNVLLNTLTEVKRLIIIEEHILQGGLGSSILEYLSDNDSHIPVKRFALDVTNGFYHRYGSREEMHAACKIGRQQIHDYIGDLKWQ
jgi:transketolase